MSQLLMRVPAEVALAGARVEGVCERPILRRVTDRLTGETTTVPIPCGSTREDVCKACAEKARKLRMQQCGEGWHITEDPLPAEPDPPESEPEDPAADGAEAVEPVERRIRSTRRIPGFPDLPKVDMAHVSVGRTFEDPRTGATFRPSMFLTLTLPSYGRITPGTGTPRHPGGYDYRRAALDALYFPRLVDRMWQNLRRCAGYKVQYFAAVEPQHRLAPHLHAAVRGAIPRRVIKDVVASTYCALWWPTIDGPDAVVYDEARGDQLPEWDPDIGGIGGYYDPATGALLPTWEEALAVVDDNPDAQPFHVLSFGEQVDIQGIIGGSEKSAKAIGYLCKYLTKSIAGVYTDPEEPDARDPAYGAHIDRLHAELRWLPCSEHCANWLRYGITPKDPQPGLVPGECDAKAHSRECLGIGGRRVLVSRHWTGKTLADHRADRSEVVRQVVDQAGIPTPDTRRLAAEILAGDGLPRYTWADVDPAERDYVAVIAASIRQHQQWRRQYETAKQLVTAGTAAEPP